MDAKLTEFTIADYQIRKQFADKLAHYARKNPKQFLQMDGFYLPDGGDDLMNPDDEGDCLQAISTVELMYMFGATVRVLIGSDADRMVAVRQLQKLAEWLEVNPDLMNLAEPAALYDNEFDDSDIPF